MSMDLNISNQNYLILPFRSRLLRLGLLLVLGNFACAVFAQPISASGAGNGKLVTQNSSTIGGMHAVVPTGPQREMPVYRISDYAQGRDDLTPGQIKIGFALTRMDMDMVTRNKYRAATLALIAKTHDDVNFPLFKGKPLTPLTNAAVMGESEIVAVLLAKGAEVNKILPGEDSTPALIGAVSGASYAYRDNPVFPLAERYVETVKVLLKAGADPNAACCGGKTAMSFALTFSTHDPAGEKAKVEIVRALLESGAAPGTQIPALVGISTENSTEIIKLLLDHGLNPNAKDSIALATAVHSRRYELVKMLLAKGADPNVPALSGGVGKRTVFADALVMGQADIALALIKAGANPNVCHDEDASGKCMNSSPFLFFLALPEPELFHAMVAHGARLDAVDAQGQTALGYAISYVKNTISLVCEAGTNHCIKPPEDKFDRIAVVKMLLDAGADPNQKSAGHPPLLMAGDSDQEIVTLLLDKGARLENLRVQGEQIGPVSQALAARRLFLAKELLRRSKGKLGTEEKWALYAAAAKGDLELAESLIQHGIKPNVRGPIGETALHYAAREGKTDMVKRLLALGANPNARTDLLPFTIPSSMNPVSLMMAKMQAYASHMQAKYDIYNAAKLRPPHPQDGYVTPLMLAAMSGKIEAAKALLDGGAESSLKSQAGFSAREIANEGGNLEMEQFLERVR